MHAVAPHPEANRQRLIEAAELMFSEHGIAGMSLRQINAAAGQRNSSALQYHFTDREGLLRAVLKRHGVEVEATRQTMLDEYEADALPDLRRLVGVLVRPLADKLSETSGRHYLRIYAEVINRPDPKLDEMVRPGRRDSLTRWRALLEPMLSPVIVHPLHRRFAAIRVASMELARRAAGRPRRTNDLFTSDLIDLVTALVSAEVSAETRQLLSSRR